MPVQNIYERDLAKTAANFEALTPISFLGRAERVYPDYLALIHGSLRQSWGETARRCRQLASALRLCGIGEGDTVSIVAPNIPAMFEAHFGVPMSGAVLNTINTRLDAESMAFIFQHAQSKVVLVDREFGPVVRKALDLLESQPLVIAIDDPLYREGALISDLDYEQFLAQGSGDEPGWLPEDEWQAISLNYTSGTTGNPKGVVYHHRGAHLNAINNVLSWELPKHPVYLWTLPMFHCNGWCFPWTLAATAGVSVCLRHVQAAAIYGALHEYKVSHFCAAPIVLNMLNNADPALKQGLDHPIKVMTAGAAPPRHRDRRYGGDGDKRDPRLRPHRNLWPLRVVRTAKKLARTGCHHALPSQGAAGRRVTPAGGRCGSSIRSVVSRWPKMAKPWAKSCCAAMW